MVQGRTLCFILITQMDLLLPQSKYGADKSKRILHGSFIPWRRWLKAMGMPADMFLLLMSIASWCKKLCVAFAFRGLSWLIHIFLFHVCTTIAIPQSLPVQNSLKGHCIMLVHLFFRGDFATSSCCDLQDDRRSPWLLHPLWRHARTSGAGVSRGEAQTNTLLEGIYYIRRYIYI